MRTLVWMITLSLAAVVAGCAGAPEEQSTHTEPGGDGTTVAPENECQGLPPNDPQVADDPAYRADAPGDDADEAPIGCPQDAANNTPTG